MASKKRRREELLPTDPLPADPDEGVEILGVVEDLGDVAPAVGEEEGVGPLLLAGPAPPRRTAPFEIVFRRVGAGQWILGARDEEGVQPVTEIGQDANLGNIFSAIHEWVATARGRGEAAGG